MQPRRLLGVELGHLLHVDADALAVEEEEVHVLQRGPARVVKVGRNGFEGHLGGRLFGEAVSVPKEKRSLCHFGRRDPWSDSAQGGGNSGPSYLGTGPRFPLHGVSSCAGWSTCELLRC